MMLHGMAEHGENIVATSAMACHLQKNPVGSGWKNSFNIRQGFKPQRLSRLPINGSAAYKEHIKI
jgi:hypothetical protein